MNLGVVAISLLKRGSDFSVRALRCAKQVQNKREVSRVGRRIGGTELGAIINARRGSCGFQMTMEPAARHSHTKMQIKQAA